MKTCTFARVGMTILTLAASALLLPAPAAAQSAQPAWETGKWQFTATLYGWVPTIDGTVNYAGDTRSSDIHVGRSDVLSALKMTFQGSLDAHNGRWGIFNDLFYADLGGAKSRTRNFSVGNIGLPVSTETDLNLDLKVLIWTVAGEYRVGSDPAWTVDLLAGARMLQMKPTLGYSITGDLGPIVIPGREGSKQVDETIWDGIVGVKGRYTFGDDRRWYAPFYVDVGTGQSQLTWQIAGGIGYSFDWGSAFAMWRYLDYNFQSGDDLEDISLNGPMVGVAFQF
jgi:hypothetical protein